MKGVVNVDVCNENFWEKQLMVLSRFEKKTSQKSLKIPEILNEY